ncbi:glucose/mannose transport system substrate-binding protein [Actinoplanes campanulatus]|uniref:Probable sugar-binding periplasmic protein n=1 Tax=Actinoplanes campanulatus TaxID=113559 RepID=A0A7W5FC20_9ACTN|nr:ABC transporter substrate-binding protein [Actinoplanes campanulatus]MBB3092755.1 glucose/mannose transport system substrate-binding protein [Actinoplanes campanulatus]GGM98816.1 sugar ABC transporter substrate-binding protein [Actinoplanes campanulatus]GID34148.1 sugar ABC transporter substrate-binding protein [Actinoplanes campanulatus]
MRTTRRALAAVVGATALLVTSACGPGEDDTAASTVEVFTWWAGGGEKAGLDALAGLFTESCPGQRFESGVVPGGAGVDAKQVLAARLQHNDAPDTFQVHAGAELLDHIDADQVRDLSAEYRTWGLRDALPAGLVADLTVNDRIYSVPAGVHRANVVWTNDQVLADAGILVAPKTLKEFIGNLERLRRSGVESPLALGRDWTQLMLLESVLISDLGPKRFSGLFTGTTKWDSRAVELAIEDYARIVEFSNTDRDSLDWPEATRLLIDGKAGYQLMGDWVTAEMAANTFSGYDSFTFPGNGMAFQWLADSFVLTTGAANPEGARCWLETVASPRGQQAFSVRKGSIPARTDAPTDGFTDYQLEAVADWRSGTPVPSCAHGSACSQPWQNAANAALGAFSTSGDATALRSALAAAAKQFIRQP